MKSKGRVPTILPISRAFTFALPVRLSPKAVPAILNGELNDLHKINREKKGDQS